MIQIQDIILDLYHRGPEDEPVRFETCSPKDIILDLYYRGPEDDSVRVETCSPK